MLVPVIEPVQPFALYKELTLQRNTPLAASRLDFTSLQQDGIKLLALLLMVGDHANAALHLNSDALMWLGRGAFPLFALVWGFNLAAGRITQRQATRLWGWALIAQPLYWLAFTPRGGMMAEMNILFLFAVMTQALCWLEWSVSRHSLLPATGAVGLVTLWLRCFPAGTFGVAGVVVMLASYLCFVPAADTRRPCGFAAYQPAAALAWVAGVLLLNRGGGSAPMVAGLLVPAGVLLVCVALRPLGDLREGRLLPRHFFPVAYAGHLALLGALSAAAP